MLILEENGNVSEKLVEKENPTSTALRFRLLFLNNNDKQIIHKVEVRNINFRDLMRHLERGESVFTSPKPLRNSSRHAKKQ